MNKDQSTLQKTETKPNQKHTKKTTVRLNPVRKKQAMAVNENKQKEHRGSTF
jgi:hypothetical protein